MPPRFLLHRALARAEHLLHTIRPHTLSAMAPSGRAVACGTGAPGPGRPGPAAARPDGPDPPAAPATAVTATADTEPCAGASLLLETPADPHHQQGLGHARAHRWHWAQRELEVAVGTAPTEWAQADLASVRAVRRQLRRLQKWPRDAQASVALGRAYFELELGAEAEQAWRQAITLAPREPAAYYLLAYEYLYRGATAAAEQVYSQAQALVPDLSPFAAFLADWQALEAEAGMGAGRPPAAPRLE